jgi:ribulose-phosphate 3-epimerase
MRAMKKIASSILSADFSRLAEEISAVEAAGTDWIHVDIMDGHFVPNITIGSGPVKWLRKITRLPFDVHLMISNPERYIDSFAEAGSDIITIHVETAGNLHRTIAQIKERGVKAGVSLNPATPLAQVEPILRDVDLLLVMSVNPGFGGQKFIEGVLPKIGRAREMVNAVSPDVIIEVDGGITLDNIRLVAEAGADVIVSGAAIFGSGDYTHTIRAMKALMGG